MTQQGTVGTVEERERAKSENALRRLEEQQQSTFDRTKLILDELQEAKKERAEIKEEIRTDIDRLSAAVNRIEQAVGTSPPPPSPE